MGEQEDSGARANEAESRLVEDLRNFVRAESGKPPETKPADQLPNWKDAFWLAILIADAASIHAWISEDLKGPLEFLDKFMPWLLGGVWAAANAWFRKTLLEYSRLPWVHRTELAFLVLAFAIWVPVVPITPKADPRGTGIVIDGADEETAPGETTWLSLRNHKIVLKPGPADPADPPPEARHLTLDWWQLLRARFNGGEIEWRRVYMAYVKAPQKTRIFVKLKKENYRFDDEFLRPVNLAKYGMTELQRVDKHDEDYERALWFDYNDTKEPASLGLPSGSYYIAMSGCAPEQRDVNPGNNNWGLLAPCQKTQGKP